MGLSAFTDDNTGQPLGAGYIRLATSANNALLFRDPASAKAYRDANPAQFFTPADGGSDGGFNDEIVLPEQ